MKTIIKTSKRAIGRIRVGEVPLKLILLCGYLFLLRPTGKSASVTMIITKVNL
jgi:hypothetical protein